MSFSEEIKNEIMNKNIKKECCLYAMRMGENMTEDKIENEKEIQKIMDLKCCTKSLIKGAFLGSGYVTHPNSEYHMEITVPYKLNMNLLKNAFLKLGIGIRNIKRGKNYVIYLKDAESISNFLSNLGASKAVMYFEQIRIEKEVKNNINRNVNCETANLNKVIITAQRQLQAIEYLKKHNKYELLNDKQKEVAMLRLKHKEASLEELSEKMINKLGKSGINHRLNKIIEIANEERGKVNE